MRTQAQSQSALASASSSAPVLPDREGPARAHRPGRRARHALGAVLVVGALLAAAFNLCAGAAAASAAPAAAPSLSRRAPCGRGAKHAHACCAPAAPLRFVCDGRSVLPCSSLNDGFCDCADGSDEPGTGACSSAPAAPRFFCGDDDGGESSVAASQVDDGVCDCCSGCADERSPEPGAARAGACGAVGRRTGRSPPRRAAARGAAPAKFAATAARRHHYNY